MKDIYNRVANWNAQRYEQEFNLELACSLLREEYNEWKDAKEPLDQLDGLCDVAYVALGIIWKIDGWPSADVILRTDQFCASIKAACEWPEIQPGYFIAGLIDSFEKDCNIGVVNSMLQIIAISLAQAQYSFNLTAEEFKEALLAVCDSNDTKVVERVAANVKANNGHKGDSYVSPSAALLEIIVHAQERNI